MNENFPAILKRYEAEVARALPRHLSSERMTRVALTEFRKNPRLGDCNPLSVFAAVVMSAQLGLELGVMGQAYLVPYGKECQLLVGYQGLLDLVRRSGKVRRIAAQVVYANDKFSYKTGLVEVLEHEPLLEGDRGEMRLAYALAEFTDGGYHVEVMTRAEIEQIRDRSKSAGSKFGKKTPWDTDAAEMWRKTVLRRICKFLPKSVELGQALALDDAASRGGQGLGLTDAIDGTWSPVFDVESAEPTLMVPEKDVFARIADAPTETDLLKLFGEIERLRSAERMLAIEAFNARKSEFQSQRVAA